MKHIKKLTRFIVVIMLFASVFTFQISEKAVSGGFCHYAMALSERGQGYH